MTCAFAKVGERVSPAVREGERERTERELVLVDQVYVCGLCLLPYGVRVHVHTCDHSCVS